MRRMNYQFKDGVDMATKDDLQNGFKRITSAGVPQRDKKAAVKEMAKVARVEPSPLTGNVAGAKTKFTYEDIYRNLHGEAETAKERAKLEKKRKRDELMASIGDGVRALSSLFFATKGSPSMYDSKRSMLGKTRVRYDQMMKDRDDKRSAWYSGLMKARMADARERDWQRQLGLDQEARDRYAESIAHRNEREQIADERYNNEQEYKRGRDEEADRRWQATFDEDKRRSDRSYNFQVRQHNDNVAVRREAAAATRARGVRGKQLGFADGNGNQVAIYENVWKGSMPSIYDALVAEGVGRMEGFSDETYKMLMNEKSASERDTYVKENWFKSDRVKAMMMALSQLDPATMTSEVSDGEDGLGWGKSNSNNSNDTDW